MRQVGSRIARFEVCSAFTHVMACVLADSLKEPFPAVLQSKIVTSLNRSRCYRLERPVTGRDSAPARINTPFHGTHTSARTSAVV
jgi:hypothetical protein